jgi:hypothetical protein
MTDSICSKCGCPSHCKDVCTKCTTVCEKCYCEKCN